MNLKLTLTQKMARELFKQQCGLIDLKSRVPTVFGTIYDGFSNGSLPADGDTDEHWANAASFLRHLANMLEVGETKPDINDRMRTYVAKIKSFVEQQSRISDLWKDFENPVELRLQNALLELHNLIEGIGPDTLEEEDDLKISDKTTE